MNVLEYPSPNHDARGGIVPDMLVLHYTGMKSGELALSRLCDRASKVSAHYMVEENGTIYVLVPEIRRAWHAGVSCWAGERDVNARSIGIELVNPGHEFGYRAFPNAQIEALIQLCKGILKRHPIPAWRVLGHSDVAPDRKEDPGELFPWARLAKAGIGLWPAPGNDPGEAAVTRLLGHFGYDKDVGLTRTVTAFQRHFRPARVDGIPDTETRKVLWGLIALYDAQKGAKA